MDDYLGWHVEDLVYSLYSEVPSMTGSGTLNDRHARGDNSGDGEGLGVADMSGDGYGNDHYCGVDMGGGRAAPPEQVRINYE